MSDTPNDPQAVDPPDDQGGANALSMDAPGDEPQAIDPPDNNGGTGAAQ